jgi:predicted MFS family arabinose efflux permease
VDTAVQTAAEPRRLDRRLVLLLAVACGATVANLYYAQPLLDAIARAFGVSQGTAGLLVTVSQLGYFTGIVLLVPLGDLVHRRPLVVRMLLVCAAGLALSAAAPGLVALAIALAVAAFTSVVAQILIPLASTLAGDEERGRVIGTVMSGVLLGILLARTFAGVIAQVAGWRTPFAVAAVAMLVLAATLRRALPDVEVPSSLPYRRALASILVLVREEPALRRRMAYGTAGFAGFSVLWTSIAFLLSRPPYGYGEATIGLFGLAGLAGAAAAQASGVLADRGFTRPATGAFLVAILAGWGLLSLGTTSVVAVLAGIVVLDLGVQGQHILNQSTIYELRPEARSRLTTAYIATQFAGGAAGSAAASVAWTAGGWSAVCGVGAAIAAVALAFWLTELRR